MMRSWSRFFSIALLALVMLTAPVTYAATLTTTLLTPSGASVASAALTAVAASGDQCPNDGRTFVVILNSSGANSYTVTLDAKATYFGQAITDPTAAVGTSAHVVLGPFPSSLFNDSGGYLNFTYVGTPGNAPATDLKIKCFRLD